MESEHLPRCRCGAEPREYVCGVPVRYGVDCMACGLDTDAWTDEDAASDEWRRLVVTEET